MKTFSNLLSLLGVIMCLGVAFFTMKGWAQEYIRFESEQSEMGFTFMMIFLAVLLVMSVVVPEKKE